MDENLGRFSNRWISITLAAALVVAIAVSGTSAELKLDERDAGAEEWGYRPAAGSVSNVNPPSFSWRPAKGLRWEVQCAKDAEFKRIEYQADNLEFNVHCPDRILQAGEYVWRYRGKDSKGQYTNWSKARPFSIAGGAAAMPMPKREEMIGRIPKSHPRLFMRPENVGHLRDLAKGKMKGEYESLVKECERLLARPPATEEPPAYPKGMARGSEEWRKIWWGNREYTIRALNGAATLAFTRLLGGQEKYGLEAKRILLECAKWDPKGSTGYRYNDEAGMPYAYYFARTYTFVNDLLSVQEKEICRGVIKVRGDEMYEHLCPRHLWQPYASHSNRAWHKLGEAGIAFLGEVEGAEDWVWFAMNVFYNVYPVWSDDDGGWHEGVILVELYRTVHLVGRRDAGGDGDRCVRQAVLLEGRLLCDVLDAAGQGQRRFRRRGESDEGIEPRAADERACGAGGQRALAVVCGTNGRAGGHRRLRWIYSRRAWKGRAEGAR